MSSGGLVEQMPGGPIAALQAAEPRAATADAEPAYQHAFLSTVMAERGDRRLAQIVVLASAIGFLAATPFAKMPVLRVDAFIPAYEAALILVDAITAVMLFGQFRWSCSPTRRSSKPRSPIWQTTPGMPCPTAGG
jgi:hypothetical protein